MKTLAVTGGIGSGKSAVTACLSGKGFPVYDCDAAAKSLYDRRPGIVDTLERLLATPLRDPSGRLDRSRLAGLIFSDPEARLRVESVVHPAVLEDFLGWRARQDAPLVAFESAIVLSLPLFDGVYDKVMLVEAPDDVRLARAMRRDGATEEAVRARMAAQSFDLSKVDLVLNNDGTPEVLRARLERALPYLFPELLLYL